MNLRLQPVQVAIGSDEAESRLVLKDGALVAVLVQLSDSYGEDASRWFLELGFGRLNHPRSPIFADLDEAQVWIKQQLSDTPE